MIITGVRVRQVFQEQRLRAIVSVTLEDIAIHDIKVISGDDRMFIAMPGREVRPGEYRDSVHPINKEARQQLESAVLNAYYEYIERLAAEENGTTDTE